MQFLTQEWVAPAGAVWVLLCYGEVGGGQVVWARLSTDTTEAPPTTPRCWAPPSEG